MVLISSTSSLILAAAFGSSLTFAVVVLAWPHRPRHGRRSSGTRRPSAPGNPPHEGRQVPPHLRLLVSFKKARRWRRAGKLQHLNVPERPGRPAGILVGYWRGTEKVGSGRLRNPTMNCAESTLCGRMAGRLLGGFAHLRNVGGHNVNRRV
jgi:hypothetical protein